MPLRQRSVCLPSQTQTAHQTDRQAQNQTISSRSKCLILRIVTGCRAPISESEQFCEALKIRKVDTALVRIPDASHMMEGRPSFLISKVVHILKWFEIHRKNEGK